jgi:quinol monooxygenase YgiN
MLLASISFRVRSDKRSEVVSAVEAIVERMGRATGCRSSRALASIEDSSILVMWSEWTDLESAEAYFESHSFQVFRGLRILLRDEPCIVFHDVRNQFTRMIRE